MAEISRAAPATYAQPSRKGKRAWRKNVDISDVQQGLDQVREEIITTGGVVGEKSADELFATDTTGDTEIARKHSGQRLLKADEILSARSKVLGLEGRKRKAKETISLSSVTGTKRQRDATYIPHKELQRLRNVADGVDGILTVPDDAPLHDPWVEAVSADNNDLNFLDKVKPKRAPKTLKQPPTSLAADGRVVPAIRKPDPGKSYNPLVGDWSALLARQGEAAVEAEQKRLAIEAEAAARQARAEAEAAKVEAAEREEYATDYESEWDGFQSEGEQEVWTQKLKARKTPSERNRIKARREREAKELWERKQKAREAQEQKIAQIAKEVSAKDKARHAHAMALTTTSQHASDPASDFEDDVQLQRRRFGKPAIPYSPLEVVLPEELEDSLRRLKPEGNLMQDRYRHLLISGKMEMRRRHQRKQPKTFSTEKWSYKDWKLR